MKVQLRSLIIAQLVLLLSASSAMADNDAHALSAATQRIQDNATGALSRLQDDDRTRQAQMQFDGDRTAARIVAEGNRVASAMSKTYITDAFGRNVPAYTSAQIQATRDSYAARADSEKSRAAQRVASLHGEYSARETSLQDSAANLQDQLAHPEAAKDGVVIQPIGTNLYVRNYQPAPRNVDEPFASKVTPLVAIPQVLPAVHKQSGRVNTVVSGRLLKSVSSKPGGIVHE